MLADQGLRDYRMRHHGDLLRSSGLLAEASALDRREAVARPTGQRSSTRQGPIPSHPAGARLPNAAGGRPSTGQSGADVNAASTGRHAETPQHWAGSSHDIQTLDALLDAGADVDAQDGAIDSTSWSTRPHFGQVARCARAVELSSRTDRREPLEHRHVVRRMWVTTSLTASPSFRRRGQRRRAPVIGTPPSLIDQQQCGWTGSRSASQPNLWPSEAQ